MIPFGFFGKDYLATILADSPVALYRFRETSGATAVDSIHGNNGTYNGSPTYSVQHGNRKGVGFSGSGSDCFVTNNLTSLVDGSHSITCEVWAYVPSGVNGVVLSEIGQPTPNTSFHDSWFEIVSGQLRVSVWDGSTANLAIANVNYDAWNYFALVQNADLTLTGYCNGSNSTVSRARIVPWDYGDQQYFTLGSPDSTEMGSGGGAAQCVVSDFAVYASPLSSSRMLAHYSAGK